MSLQMLTPIELAPNLTLQNHQPLTEYNAEMLNTLE